MNTTDKKEAYRVTEFCDLYGVAKSKVYEEMAAGRLKVRKLGSRSLIARVDAEAWLMNLPLQEVAA